jgi:hypothetical protein
MFVPNKVNEACTKPKIRTHGNMTKTWYNKELGVKITTKQGAQSRCHKPYFPLTLTSGPQLLPLFYFIFKKNILLMSRFCYIIFFSV